DRQRREHDARERADREQRTEPRRELWALLGDERDRSDEDERTGREQEDGLASGLLAGSRHAQEQDEERRTQAERDTSVRQSAARDLEWLRRRRTRADVRHGGERPAPDHECEVALRGVP